MARGEGLQQRRCDRDGDGGWVLAGDPGLADRAGDPADRLGGVAGRGQLGRKARPLGGRADQPDAAQWLRQPQGRVAQGEVLRVVVRHDHHVRAARQPLEYLLAEQRVVDTDVRGAVDHVREPDPVQLLGARVGQQQPDR